MHKLVFTYEIERIFLTDENAQPAQMPDAMAYIQADSAMNAVLAFVEREGARLLGSVCDSPGDQCTATAWRGGRLYVMTAWREGHRPIDPLAKADDKREPSVSRR